MPATAKSSAPNDDSEDFYLEEAVFYPYLQIISEKSGNKSKLFPKNPEIILKKGLEEGISGLELHIRGRKGCLVLVYIRVFG